MFTDKQREIADRLQNHIMTEHEDGVVIENIKKENNYIRTKIKMQTPSYEQRYRPFCI